MKITIEQFLLGSYLGDGAFIKKTVNHNTYVVFKHAESQREYLEWKHEVASYYGLTDDGQKGIVEVTLREGSCFPNHQAQFKFATRSLSSLNEYKTLTDEDIVKRFDEGALAVWVLDDGNVYNKRIKISCGLMSKSLALALTNKLQQHLQLDCYYYEHPTNSHKNYIVIRANSYDTVRNIILQYLPSDIDVVQDKFNDELVIEIKYHSDITPIEPSRPNSDWVDLRVAEDVELKAGEFKIIPLGVSMKLPKGYEALIIPRSSTFKTWGVIQTNHCGLIDNTYCGDDDTWMFPALATRDVTIEKDSRICQFRIQKCMPKFKFKTVSKLKGKNRKGFGSSGIK